MKKKTAMENPRLVALLKPGRGPSSLSLYDLVEVLEEIRSYPESEWDAKAWRLFAGKLEPFFGLKVPAKPRKVKPKFSAVQRAKGPQARKQQAAQKYGEVDKLLSAILTGNGAHWENVKLTDYVFYSQAAAKHLHQVGQAAPEYSETERERQRLIDIKAILDWQAVWQRVKIKAAEHRKKL